MLIVTLTNVASLSLANMSWKKESLRASYFDNILTGLNQDCRKISATNRKTMYIGWRLSSGNYGRIIHSLIERKGTCTVPSVGIEPTTLGLLDPRSNQLSYEGMPKQGGWAQIYGTCGPHTATQWLSLLLRQHSTNNRFVPSSPRACYRAYEHYNFLSVQAGIAISTTTETRTQKRRHWQDSNLRGINPVDF